MREITKMPGEEEVTVESLGKSLEDLIKAADATDVLRKGEVESSGHVDERGTEPEGEVRPQGAVVIKPPDIAVKTVPPRFIRPQ